MKTELWLVGKTSYPYIDEGVAIYEKRVKHYIPFEIQIIPNPKLPSTAEPAIVKAREGEAIVKKINPDDFLILLDERGKTYSSAAFATYMEKQLSSSSAKRIIFLVGGAYGFSPEVYQRANAQWSISTMTISHQIIRLFIMEQLYRAMTILNNEPYHHA
jgi:23S rRNA (pseudouridine1915-N3)-methyltransferase